MAAKNTSLIWRAVAAALIVAGVWLLHKPAVAIFWLVKTGELPVLVLKRRGLWTWFETFVQPWSIEGFKSWAAYALLVIFGTIVWTFAIGLLTELPILWRILKFCLYCIYVLFAAVAVLVLFEWRIL